MRGDGGHREIFVRHPVDEVDGLVGCGRRLCVRRAPSGGGTGALDSGDDVYELPTKRQRSSIDIPQAPSSWTSLLPRSAQHQLMLGGYHGSGSGSSSQTHLPFSSSSRQPRSFPVVRLRGLPFNSSELDVYEFFAGLDVVDVLLVERNKQGRFSGDAFVVFGAPSQVDFALQRNRLKIGKRYIEVFRSRKQDYYQAVAAHVADGSSSLSSQDDLYGGRGGRNAPGSPPGKRNLVPGDRNRLGEYTGVLKLRGLPFAVSKRDIIEFFREYGELTEESVHILTLANGRASGEAFVEFASGAEAKAAMNKDKMILGSRYIDLFPSSRQEATSRAASKSR